MPPSNTSFATATLISSLPYNFTQTDINDGGVNYTVYYKFIAPTNARVIGAWGFSGNIGAGYRPLIKPYNGPASTPTQILSIAAQNVPIQFPVVPGNEYFLVFEKNVDSAGPEHLDVKVEVAPLHAVSVGNIIVNDDTPGFPLAVLSHLVNYAVINFVKDMATGEAGDVLPSGISAFENGSDNTVKVYDSNFGLIATTAPQTGTIRIRSCRGTNQFWVGLNKNPSTAMSLTAAGVLGIVHTLTGNASLESLCASNDETILYHAAIGFGVPVKRWDLIGDVQLSDLAALIAGYQIPDILVLSDDTILVLYYNSATRDVQVKRYSAAGATLNTYSLGAQTGITKPRAAYALDTPNSFWVWTHNTNGISVFRNVRVSDGFVLTTRNHAEYEGGAYQGSETATPTARFGNSYSCPFFIHPAVAVIGGIYYIHPGKTTGGGTGKHDSYYNGIENAIPTPLFRSAFFGE